MCRNGYVSSVVGGSPTIGSEVDPTGVLLQPPPSQLRSSLRDSWAHLQELSNALARLREGLLDVAGDGCRVRYPVHGPPCLHQALKSAIVYNLEWSTALGYPTNNLSAGAHQEG